MRVKAAHVSIALVIVCVCGVGFHVPPVTRAAFSADTLSEHAIVFETGTTDVFVISADGTTLLYLAHAGADVASPQWSPDGQRIAFSTELDGNREIAVINADGTEFINLTQHPASDMLPVWFPDGQQLLFNRWYGADQPSEMMVMNADGTDQRRFLDDHKAIGFAWSPTGEWGVYEAYTDNSALASALFRVSIDGREVVQLTPDDDAYVSYPTWSPDGTQLAFKSRRGGNAEIYVIDVDGASLEQLTDTPDIAENAPSWSPDGRFIAYKRDNSVVYVMSTDGTQHIRIGDDTFLTDVFDFAWSPDGSYLAISGREGWDHYLTVVDLHCVESDAGCGREYARNLFAAHREASGLSWAISLSWRPPIHTQDR